MPSRYTSVAISLHWLIALLIIGLIAIGKYMDGLEETDHLRFELIQWHKSFGILVLLLIVIRILWRLTHKPPQLTVAMAAWEKFAASATHVLLYLLMLAIPISGWVMVSASPLNLATELFGAVPWPHLPLGTADGYSDSARETIAGGAHQAHHLLANGLLALVILHTAAALRHQFIFKDNLISRMWISDEHRMRADLSHALVPGVLLAAALGLFLWERSASEAPTQAQIQTEAQTQTQAQTEASASPVAVADTVGFTATQMGEPLEGTFDTVAIDLVIDDAGSSLNATVQTASVNTGDGQVDSTVVTADWFASDEHPEAQFSSTSIEPAADANTYTVTGTLVIRGNSQPVSFLMSVANGTASASFAINREDFGVGVGGQDEFVESEITIRFETAVN